MPVRDGARFLRPALESVLAQEGADFELLVLDDGSLDGSPEIVRSYRDPRIRLIENRGRLGLPATLNRGLREARGALVARQDADDLSLPGRLAAQLEALRASPELALLGAQGRLVDEHGARRGSLVRACEPDAIAWELLFDNAFLHTAVVFRRAVVLDELGGYDESFTYCQDRELWVRLVQRYRSANLDRTLVACRFHPNTMTATLLDDNAAENARITPQAFRAFLNRAATEPELELLARFRVGTLDDTTLARFVELLEQLREAFVGRHAGVVRSRDFRRAVARQYVRLALSRGASAGARLRWLCAGARRGHPVWSAAAQAVLGRWGLTG